MLEVRRDADVGVEQVVGPLVIRHRALVEEDVPPGQPELTRELLGLPRDLHLRHAGVGVLHAHEEEPDLRVAVLEAVDGADQGQRVEPVVDPTAPDDRLVVRPDAGHGSLDRMAALHRRGVLDAERHHGDEVVEVLVLVVDGGVDPPLTGELAEPEVPLLVRRAEQEVRPAQLLVQGVRGHLDRVHPAVRAEVLGLLELLEVHRVVDVRDDDLAAALDPERGLQQEALEDDHVGPAGRLAQAGAGRVLDREIPACPLRAGGRDQPDLVLGCQCLGDLPGTDRPGPAMRSSTGSPVTTRMR